MTGYIEDSSDEGRLLLQISKASLQSLFRCLDKIRSSSADIISILA